MFKMCKRNSKTYGKRMVYKKIILISLILFSCTTPPNIHKVKVNTYPDMALEPIKMPVVVELKNVRINFVPRNDYVLRGNYVGYSMYDGNIHEIYVYGYYAQDGKITTEKHILGDQIQQQCNIINFRIKR